MNPSYYSLIQSNKLTEIKGLNVKSSTLLEEWVMSEDVRLKQTQMGNVAALDWEERVTHFDRRVVIGLAMIGRRSRALRGFKETQLTRIANLAIRELLPSPQL